MDNWYPYLASLYYAGYNANSSAFSSNAIASSNNENGSAARVIKYGAYGEVVISARQRWLTIPFLKAGTSFINGENWNLKKTILTGITLMNK